MHGYFEILDESARDVYLTTNKNDIVTALSTLLGVSSEVESIANRTRRLESRIIAGDILINKYQRVILEMYDRLMVIKDSNSRLEDLLINASDSISYYQTKILNKEPVHAQNNNIVLYFKELEDIDFFRFYESIYKYLKIRGLYVKSILITDKSYINYEELDYKRCTDSVTLAFLSKYDKFVRMGAMDVMLDIITSEQFCTEVVMIYDKGRELKPYLTSPNTTTFYIGKYRQAYPDIEIPDSSFISPYEGAWTGAKDLFKSVYDKSIPDSVFEAYAYRHGICSVITEIVEEQIQGTL